MSNTRRVVFGITMIAAAVLGGVTGHQFRSTGHSPAMKVGVKPVRDSLDLAASSAGEGARERHQAALPDTAQARTYTGDDQVFQAFLGMASDTSYPTRLGALETIFTRKSSEDFALLYAFLEGQLTAHELSAEDQQILQKHIYEYLFDNEQNSARLQSHAVRILTGSRAIGSAEALLGLIERLFERPGNHADVVNQLQRLQEHVGSDLAVPALAALGRIESVHPGTLDKQQVSELVNNALLAPTSSTEKRVLALQLGAWLKLATVTDAARSLAGNAEHEDTVRIAALSVIGKQGDSSDISWLTELEKRSAYPISTTARQMRKLLEQR